MRTRSGLVVLMNLLVLASAKAEGTRSVTVYRDNWGVPHVYAERAEDGAYGLGYAQAEDRLVDIYANLRTGLGSMAEAFGPRFVDQDYVMKLCRNEELAQEYWKTAPDNLKALMTAFAAGVQRYVDEHPDKIPPSALPLEPWKFLCIGRAMILRWPLGSIQDDLKNQAQRDPVPMRSNEWAVSPRRTKDNSAILLADPHLTWEGMAVLYEARVHAGDLHMNGFFLVGAPLMGYGHNRNVGWANTTGGPDTADVYRMKMKTAILPQYEYDGEWRNAQIRVIKIAVKGEKPVTRPALHTHLGPVIQAPDKEGIAYVGATPYLESMRFFEQFYRMNLAKSARELYEALGMNEYNEQNVMFADTAGTIAYVRNGRVPIRPDGYDWRAPVPGHTSSTGWRGIHSIDDLVQVFDPPSGYMQNCNIHPSTMMVDSPLRPENYKPYIYNAFDWETNPRGTRATMLLEADKAVTRDRAREYALDVYDLAAAPWQQALRAALGDGGVGLDPAVKAAAEGILAWDGRYLTECTATALFKAWREKCQREPWVAALGAGEKLAAADQARMLDRLRDATAEMTTSHGRWDIAWGDLYRIGRGTRRFGVPGADFGSRQEPGNFTETLFDIKSNPDPENPGRYLAGSGSMALMLMFFTKDGVESQSAAAWGQSADPDSPHFLDQAEKLFSKRQLKPTYWRKEELMDNLASTKVLATPANVP